MTQRTSKLYFLNRFPQAPIPPRSSEFLLHAQDPSDKPTPWRSVSFRKLVVARPVGKYSAFYATRVLSCSWAHATDACTERDESNVNTPILFFIIYFSIILILLIMFCPHLAVFFNPALSLSLSLSRPNIFSSPSSWTLGNLSGSLDNRMGVKLFSCACVIPRRLTEWEENKALCIRNLGTR